MPVSILRSKSKVIASILATAWTSSALIAEDRAGSRANFKDPDAVTALQSGNTDTANAAWWGFDPEDATDAVQSAIDSGAAKVVIPYLGMEWIVQPLTLASNQEILFEPGVVLTAKQGSFRGESDSLLTGNNVRNVTISGYGAVLRMRKEDYATAQYARSESGRHVLALHGVKDVYVAGVTFQSSGGDGIYLGPTLDPRRLPSEDVVIEDCVCNDNLRRGMRIVSARRVDVENCTFRSTRGASPESGLDVQPESELDVVVDVEIRDCLAVNNEGTGFVATFTELDATSAPVSLRFVDCRVLNTRQSGFRAFLRGEASPRGIVEFINCTAEGSDFAGAMVVWNAAAPIKLRYENCKWRRTALQSSQSPLEVQLLTSASQPGGGVEFDDCYIYDDKRRIPLRFVDLTSTGPSSAISGQIHYINSEIDSAGETTEEILPRLKVQYSQRQR